MNEEQTPLIHPAACSKAAWLRSFRVALASLAVGAVSTASTWSAETPVGTPAPPWERASMRLGGFVASFDSTLGFGLGGGAGIELDAEELLGMDSTLTVFRVDALYRLGESRRHRLDFSFASFNRSAEKTLAERIDIDGEILLPGTQIESVFDFDLYRLTYSYSVFQDDRVNLGVGLGMYVAPVKYGLDIVTPGDNRTLEVRDATLPLPALALRGDFKVTPKVVLYGEVDLMYLEWSDFSGSLLDFRLGAEYLFTQHFGLGLGFNAFQIDVESEASGSDYPGVDFVGSVNLRFTGLLLYGKLSF